MPQISFLSLTIAPSPIHLRRALSSICLRRRLCECFSPFGPPLSPCAQRPATMASQSRAAYSDYSYHQSRSAYTIGSASYTSRDTSASSHDMNSLAHHFGQQSLHNSRNNSPYHTPSSSSGSYHTSVQQSHATASAYHTTSPSSHQSSVYSQRPLTCQMGHLQPLSSTGAHMIATTHCAQCNATVMVQHIQSVEVWEDETLGEEDEFEDEGFAEPQIPARLTYRRSTDLIAGGQAYVSKAIRIRKKHRSNPSNLRSTQ